MRHLFLALLIALLPLRGWVGDAMATQMAAGQIQHAQSQQHGQQHSATKTIAEHQEFISARSHSDHQQTAEAPPTAEPDCAGHSADKSTSESAHAADGRCESCAACQACNTVALSLMEPDLSPVFNALALSLPAADHFVSADAALGQKPPIS